MCGILGLIAKGTKKADSAKEAFHDAIYFNRLRGIDSLGMIRVTKSHYYASTKAVGDPFKLLMTNTELKHNWEEAGNSRFWVCHNRHATRGSASDVDCAHPIVVKMKHHPKSDVMLVHNGTLSDIRNDVTGKSDTQKIAKLLAAEVPLEEIYRDIFGSFVFIWYNSYENSLNFWRNAERPLAFIHTADHIWFGSELYPLAGAMERNGLYPTDFKRMETLKHYKWHAEDKKFEVRDVKQAPAKVYVSPKEQPAVTKKDPIILPADCDDLTATGPCHTPKVIPFPGNPAFREKEQMDSLALNPKQVSFHASHHYGSGNHGLTYKNLTKKLKFTVAQEFQDFKPGSCVTFTVDTVSPTKQGSQLKINGIGIEWNNAGQSVLAASIAIEGMMQRTDDVAENKIKTLFMAEIVTILVEKKSNRVAKFVVKDITITDLPDHHRKPPEKELSKALTQVETKVLEGEVIPKGVDLQSPCEDCGVVLPKSKLHRIKWKKGDTLELWFCEGCFTTNIADDVHLLSLLNEKRKYGSALDRAETLIHEQAIEKLDVTGTGSILH